MIEGGPGWQMDPVTLRPVITDEPVFRTRYANDPALEVLVALWTGEPDRALDALEPLLAVAPDNWRWRTLRADARRELGDHHEAIAEYRELIREHGDTAREAVLVQHLGKAHFTAEEYESAAACFERALNLRVAAGAEQSLVESSRIALRRARQLSTQAADTSARPVRDDHHRPRQ